MKLTAKFVPSTLRASAIAASQSLSADESNGFPLASVPWRGGGVHEHKRQISARISGTFCVSPMMAAVLVMTASPSGPVGLVQESAAAGRMIVEAANTAQTPLLKSLADDMKSSMSIPRVPPGATPTAVQEAATEILRSTLIRGLAASGHLPADSAHNTPSSPLGRCAKAFHRTNT